MCMVVITRRTTYLRFIGRSPVEETDRSNKSQQQEEEAALNNHTVKTFREKFPL
jgi:hypothetical protein